MTPGEPRAQEKGLPDALRAAVERTLRTLPARPARAGADALDELARRGREARDEIARRGTQARGELARRLEVLERRRGSIEDLLREQGKSKGRSED